ncbi:unnamed protein product [Prunus brigantina]
MAKHPRMVQYLDKVQGLLKEFPTFSIQQVPRAENTHADALASLGSALDTQFRRSIPVEHLDRPSIEEIELIDSMQIDEDPSWQDPIIDYLVNGNLPTDKSEARKVQQKAARYYMHGNKLIQQNSEQMRLNLDLLEGEREKAIRLKSYYDKIAKIRQFQPDDLVLRKAFITTQRQGSKKIKSNWEGPYVISRSGGRGSYTLDTMDGKEIPRQWNAYHLRKYYP